MQINVLNYLKEHSKDKSTYAVVKYDNKEEIIYFVNYLSMEYGIGFIEKPCYLHKIYFGKDLEKFCKHYAESIIGLDNKDGVDNYIKNKILPYVKDDVFLLIDTPTVELYIPQFVDEIKLISEQECIELLLERN